MSRATLGPTGIAPLDLNIDNQNFMHNFVVCTKLKQHLILGLDFAQRFRVGIDWDTSGNFFLRHEGKKITCSMKTHNFGQQVITSLKISADKQNET